MHCYSHPQIATSVACGRCGRPICTQCMVSGPAGMRCPDCGLFRSALSADDNPGRLGLALLAGMATAFALSYVMAYLVSWVGFLVCICGPIYGILVAEAVQRVAGRQKGRTLQAIGVGSALLGLLTVFVMEYGGPKPLPVALPQVTWPMFGIAITLAVSCCLKRLKS